MKELTAPQRQTLARVVRATAAGQWYRAADSGERVTLASLHNNRRLLNRRVWKESKAAAERGEYSSPAHEYQAIGVVMRVALDLYPELKKLAVAGS